MAVGYKCGCSPSSSSLLSDESLASSSRWPRDDGGGRRRPDAADDGGDDDIAGALFLAPLPSLEARWLDAVPAFARLPSAPTVGRAMEGGFFLAAFALTGGVGWSPSP